MGETVVIVAIGLIFIAVGLYSGIRETPMHFWAGSTVKAEEINDIKSYNKANGIMWATYGSVYLISGLTSLLKLSLITSIIFFIAIFPGIVILIIVYRRIYNKYKT